MPQRGCNCARVTQHPHHGRLRVRSAFTIALGLKCFNTEPGECKCRHKTKLQQREDEMSQQTLRKTSARGLTWPPTAVPT